MNRRALLSAAAGGLAGMAGCTGGPGRESPTPTRTSTPTATATDLPLARQGTPPTICEQDVLDVGIDAIDEPAFGPDWTDVEVRSRYTFDGGLGDDQAVVGLAGDGRARAYPVSVLYHHEIVNDAFAPAGGPVLVTYCSLCRSGMVARRVVDDEPATFVVSGQLWTPPELQTRRAAADDRAFAVERRDADPGGVRNAGNLVMLDLRSRSYWSQILARGICGPERGTELEVVVAETATWGDWRRAHSDTEVLLPPPTSGVREPPY